MRKFYIALLVVFSMLQNAYAQTKIFKEVRDGSSTKIRPIMQDETLVGYLSCTELERANRDSFSYRITIMDENLNDIGVVNFKELKLDLSAVSFDENVICLA
jgi:hypothetical protein